MEIDSKDNQWFNRAHGSGHVWLIFPANMSNSAIKKIIKNSDLNKPPGIGSIKFKRTLGTNIMLFVHSEELAETLDDWIPTFENDAVDAELSGFYEPWFSPNGLNRGGIVIGIHKGQTMVTASGNASTNLHRPLKNRFVKRILYVNADDMIRIKMRFQEGKDYNVVYLDE